MPLIKIETVARSGTEDFLLMLLAGEAAGLPERTVNAEAVESYLDRNPDEALLFDQETILRVKRQIQAMEDIALGTGAPMAFKTVKRVKISA
jgi:hypothetical protein